MVRRTKKALNRRNSHFLDLSNLNFRKVLIIILIGIVGFSAIQAIKAATYGTGGEAESGTLSGNASTKNDANASNSSAVTFGAYITPSNLQAFTGGNNIALVWDMPSGPVQSIQVYRDNQQIATVSPTASAPFQNGKLGKEYDDSNVTAGITYQYKIRAITSTGATSAFTSTVSAIRPTSTSPVPTITVDTSKAAQYSTLISSNVVPMLKTWYPKVSDKIAYPTYTPPANFKIVIDPAYIGACATGNDIITCDPNWINGQVNASTPAGNNIAATFVHESTHVVQNGYPNDTTGWAQEGMASWASDFYARQNINSYIPHAGEPLGGYTVGAYFINYIRKTYTDNFPRDVNLAQHGGVYSSTVFANDTGGKTQAQVWQEAINQYNSSTSTIADSAGKCLEVQNGTVGYGTKLQINTCSGANQQKWALTYHNTSKTGLFEITTPSIGNPTGTQWCVDVSASGTADGSIVQYWGCNQTNAQLWTKGSNGSLVNVNSGKCLDTSGGSSANGTQIVINTCTGSASQNWATP
ncbi:MAG TPA: ricin-type beta-trefoil lectin domain protein [Candidatus Saccharimonadales bacterium]|nr:ricin-type beta-trefoil lectin domain protein [Candidatus Saccharimonadales bacterium]